MGITMFPVGHSLKGLGLKTKSTQELGQYNLNFKEDSFSWNEENIFILSKSLERNCSVTLIQIRRDPKDHSHSCTVHVTMSQKSWIFFIRYKVHNSQLMKTTLAPGSCQPHTSSWPWYQTLWAPIIDNNVSSDDNNERITTRWWSWDEAKEDGSARCTCNIEQQGSKEWCNSWLASWGCTSSTSKGFSCNKPWRVRNHEIEMLQSWGQYT